jgi:hypothetical protein
MQFQVNHLPQRQNMFRQKQYVTVARQQATTKRITAVCLNKFPLQLRPSDNPLSVFVHSTVKIRISVPIGTLSTAVNIALMQGQTVPPQAMPSSRHKIMNVTRVGIRTPTQQSKHNATNVPIAHGQRQVTPLLRL